MQVYGLPFGFTRIYQRKVGIPMRAACRRTVEPLAPCWRPVRPGQLSKP